MTSKPRAHGSWDRNPTHAHSPGVDILPSIPVLTRALGLAVLVVLFPACGAEPEGGGDSTTSEVDGSGPGGELPPPVTEACGAGEVSDDLLCLQACPADVDQIAAGLQVECDPTEIRSAADGTALEVDLAPCEPGPVVPAGRDACFSIILDDGLGGDCFEDGWQVRIEVTRTEGSEVGCRIQPRCQLSHNADIDCPDGPSPPSVCGDGLCVLGEGCSDCPEDCDACADYSSCDEESDCSDPTPYCATPKVFDDGAMCTIACDGLHLCPEFVETGKRASCMDGACVVRCEGDDECPAGMSCVDLGPIDPSGNVFVCMP